jgi:hypothetical protein
MSSQVMKVLVPPTIDVPRVAPLVDALAGWWQRRPRGREENLLQLAREVEGDEPELACELRGIAMHEAAAASRRPVQRESPWRRAGRRIWKALEAGGQARAKRELLQLAQRLESTEPALAKELRSACSG